jgi:hypothetical protein
MGGCCPHLVPLFIPTLRSVCPFFVLSSPASQALPLHYAGCCFSFVGTSGCFALVLTQPVWDFNVAYAVQSALFSIKYLAARFLASPLLYVGLFVCKVGNTQSAGNNEGLNMGN